MKSTEAKVGAFILGLRGCVGHNSLFRYQVRVSRKTDTIPHVSSVRGRLRAWNGGAVRRDFRRQGDIGAT